VKHCVDEDEVMFEYKGVEEPDENMMLAILLIEEHLVPHAVKDDETGIVTTALYVNTSDVFAWGYSNFDCADLDEMFDLYKLTRASKKWGSIKWICYKDNLQPQYPIVRDMKLDDAWDEKMENLPKNKH